MYAICQTQRIALLTVRKIEIVKRMLKDNTYSHERSQAVLRRELKKLQALRDKCRKIIKAIIDKEYKSFEGITATKIL